MRSGRAAGENVAALFGVAWKAGETTKERERRQSAQAGARLAGEFMVRVVRFLGG